MGTDQLNACVSRCSRPSVNARHGTCSRSEHWSRMTAWRCLNAPRTESAVAIVRARYRHGFASRYQAWNDQVSPDRAALGPAGVGRLDTSTRNANRPVAPEFST